MSGHDTQTEKMRLRELAGTDIDPDRDWIYYNGHFTRNTKPTDPPKKKEFVVHYSPTY